MALIYKKRFEVLHKMFKANIITSIHISILDSDFFIHSFENFNLMQHLLGTGKNTKYNYGK